MKNSSREMKTVVQCDFDGTVTLEDQAFLLLDAFASGDWRQYLDEYREGRISVGDFNTKSFALVSTDRQTLADFTRNSVRVRAGFENLVLYCRKNNFRLVIVSNGLDFYIEETLKDIGADDVEVFAAVTRFGSGGLDVKYIGPDGTRLQDGFKEAYTRSLLGEGYRVVYVGNGPSDMPSARLAHRIFATGELSALCKDTSLNYSSFVDFNEIVKGLGYQGV